MTEVNKKTYILTHFINIQIEKDILLTHFSDITSSNSFTCMTNTVHRMKSKFLTSVDMSCQFYNKQMICCSNLDKDHILWIHENLSGHLLFHILHTFQFLSDYFLSLFGQFYYYSHNCLSFIVILVFLPMCLGLCFIFLLGYRLFLTLLFPLPLVLLLEDLKLKHANFWSEITNCGIFSIQYSRVHSLETYRIQKSAGKDLKHTESEKLIHNCYFVLKPWIISLN